MSGIKIVFEIQDGGTSFFVVQQSDVEAWIEFDSDGLFAGSTWVSRFPDREQKALARRLHSLLESALVDSERSFRASPTER